MKVKENKKGNKIYNNGIHVSDMYQIYHWNLIRG